MLTVDENARPTASECYQHPWFKAEHIVNANAEQVPISSDIVNNLKAFKGISSLRRSCLTILAKMLNPNEFKQLREEFNKIDTNLSGTIETSELKDAVRKANMDLTEKELDNIVKQCDYDENGLINYHEFIAATFPVDKYLTKEKIESLFSRFDVDQSEAITTTNFRQAFTKLGIDLSSEELDQILKEHDLDGDHTITLQEFE